MIVISDPRARPAGWLLAAFGVTLICFYYPLVLIHQSPHPEDERSYVSVETMRYFPLAVLASLAALFSYLALWRRVRGRGDLTSSCLRAGGAAVLLVASGPGLLLLAMLALFVWFSFVHPA